MSVALKLLIEKTEAAIAAAADPRKKLRLERDLASFKLAALRAEGGDDEGDEDDDEDDDSKAKKAAADEKKAKKAAEAAKHRAKAAEYKRKMAEAEEDAKSAEEDDEDEDEAEEKKAARAARVARAEAPPFAPSAATSAAVAANSEFARITKSNADELAKIKADLEKERQEAAIKSALADGRITPAESKMLASKSPAWCTEYIATRQGVRVLATDEGHLVMPKDAAGGGQSEAEMKEIDARILQLGVKDPEKIKSLRTEMIANRRKALNGAPEGRY